MMIKVEVDEAENGARKYPYFGKFDDGVVILFTAPKSGYAVYYPEGMGGANNLWQYHESWRECKTKPLPKGTKITLTQE